MKNKKLLIASIAFISSNALAAGYSTNTTSTAALATSYAGSSTGSHDISNMHHNPAILSKFDKQFIASISYLDVDIDPQNETYGGSANSAGAQTGDAGVNVVIPAFYFSTPIAQDTNLGLLVNSPFGLATEYNHEWAGATLNNDTEIKTINLGTKLSHKLTDKLSVGLGINAQKLQYTATFKNHANSTYNKFKGSDWGYGYSLGLNYDLCDRLSLGAGYQSKVKHEVTGKYQVAGSVFGSYAKIETPESANIGAKYAINDKLNLMSDISWTRWSRNDVTPITNSATGSDIVTIESKWHDSFMYSLGGDYQYNNDLLIRFGGAFETGAPDDQYRSPNVPTGDVYWLNAGINYDLGNDLSVDATYLHQFYENVKVNRNDLASQTVNASYRTQVNLFSVALKKNF